MTTRKRPPSGNGFSLADPEEKTPEIETVVEKNPIESEAPVKVEVEETKKEMPESITKEIEISELEEKTPNTPLEKSPEAEFHVNPEPNKVGELIRPRRNVPRFVR